MSNVGVKELVVCVPRLLSLQSRFRDGFFRNAIGEIQIERGVKKFRGLSIVHINHEPLALLRVIPCPLLGATSRSQTSDHPPRNSLPPTPG